jgi:hypothetical protein
MEKYSVSPTPRPPYTSCYSSLHIFFTYMALASLTSPPFFQKYKFLLLRIFFPLQYIYACALTTHLRIMTVLGLVSLHCHFVSTRHLRLIQPCTFQLVLFSKVFKNKLSLTCSIFISTLTHLHSILLFST